MAADVCRALEIANPSDALRRMDDDEKMTLDSNEGHSGQRGGAQSFNVVNESGLYSLVLGSRKPEARAFKRWITHDVIPSIRRYGAYMTAQTIQDVISDPANMIKLLQALQDEQGKRRALEAQAEANAPKILFADSVAASDTTILVGDLAKLLRQNGVDIGQKRLFERLRNDGYLIKQRGMSWNMPTQRSMDAGLFSVKETAITHADGHVSVNKTVKVTGRGQQFFINKFIGGGN